MENELDVSKPVNKVVPTGIYAQTLMETLFPEAMLSLAKEVSSDLADFEEAGLGEVAKLPEIGAIQGNFDKAIEYEKIKELNPDLILVVGFDSNKSKAVVDEIQANTGIQTVYLDISYGKLSQAYQTLGMILGCSDRANEIVDYIENAQLKAIEAIHSDEKGLTVFYGPRSAGKKVSDGVWTQVKALEMLGFYPITSPYDFEKRIVDFEVLKTKDPNFILLDDTTFCSEFFSANGEIYNLWRNIPAVSEGRFAVAPALIHSILGSAVFTQSIGMLWMAYVLMREESQIDIALEMRLFYQLFYNLDRKESEMHVLLGMGEQNA